MESFAGYKIVRELGSGATAKVYLALDPVDSKQICLKIFHPNILNDINFSQRLLRELKISDQLKHPNIVQVHECIQNDEQSALVLDYIEGQNLEEFQSKLPYILPEISVLILIEILEALEHSHKHGIIHRDLKPENVLIQDRGRVFVTDFGLAKSSKLTMLTQSNSLLGTIDYMSPEQVKGDILSPQSDVFSAASILYFLTTGTRPFARTNLMATLKAIQEEPLDPPQSRNPKISCQLSRMIEKGLSKDLKDRYQNAAEFKKDLEQYLEAMGLTIQQCSLHQWMKRTSEVTLEYLNLATEKIITNCDQALKAKNWTHFFEELSHLGIKSPHSPAFQRLNATYLKLRQKKKQKWALLLLLLLPIPFYFLLKPAHVIDRPVLPEKTVSAATPVVVSGTVIFKVDEDTEVYWDKKKVDVSKPLTDVPLGDHEMQLRKSGFDPIVSNIKVLSDKPVEINAR